MFNSAILRRNPLKSSALRAGALRLLVLVAALLMSASPAEAQLVHSYTNTTDSALNGISDTTTPCSNTFKRTFSVGSFSVGDVNIGVLMAHTYRGDLAMYLTSPTGTRIQLASGAGAGGNDNYNAMFDDQASSAVSNYTATDVATPTTVVPPYNGSYRPISALSGFNGQAAAGTWTLEICDQAAQDSGTFYQADLVISEPVPYADLSLAKSVSNASPSAGAAISYTLTIANASTSSLSATGVVVKDLLPAGVTFVSSSGSGTYASSTGLWNVGTLAPGGSASLTINVTVTASAGATITNTAEITASSAADIDSTPNNGVTTEDDYAARSFTVAGSRVAGTPPALSCPAGNTLFDWDNVSWTAGATSNSYAVTGLGTIGFAITNPGSFLNNSTYGGQSPTRQNVVTGGLATAQYSLMELVDLTSQSDVVATTISLPTAVPGAQFTIFDVDYNSGQFADKVTVIGSYGGASVTPTLTNGVANYVIGNSAYGDVTSGDTQSNGNVVVTFASAVDTIIISYGNHSLAPSNPGQQAIALHDITFCKPQTSLSVTKVSNVISDPINGATNPKAIPGAVMQYCILISNASAGTATNVSAADALPATITYSAGSMKSGTSCATAATAEDDDNIGTDETDPFGASISGTTITAIAASLAPSSAFALRFNALVK